MSWQDIIAKKYYPMTDRINTELRATMLQARTEALKIFNEFGKTFIHKEPTVSEINETINSLKTLISTLEQDVSKLRQDIDSQAHARQFFQNINTRPPTKLSELRSTTQNPLDTALESSRR